MNDKLIQIGGKSYKECEVVMLSTKEQRWKIGNEHVDRYEFYSFVDKKLYSRQSNAYNWSLSHLYILSSKEIKEGEYYYDVRRNNIGKRELHSGSLNNFKYYKKIIATTDESLKIEYNKYLICDNCNTPHTSKDGLYCDCCRKLNKPSLKYDYKSLPRPSDDFIKAFVKAHGKIDKVLVEYDYKFSTISEGKPGFPEDDISWWNYKLKVSSDNTVTIRAFEKEKRNIDDVHKECLDYLLTQVEKPADPMNNLVSFNAAQMALNLIVSEIKLGRVKI